MVPAYAFWLALIITYDFRQRRVPNWLVLAGIGLGVIAMIAELHPPGPSWADALGAGMLAFGVMLVFYAFGLMGAGDVKFAGALGFWVGMQGLLPVWIASSLLAAAHGLLWYALNRWPVWPGLAIALSGAPPAPGAPSPKRARHIPYAAYLAIAALAWAAWNLHG
jgi:prepilin peptidase CpaA